MLGHNTSYHYGNSGDQHGCPDDRSDDDAGSREIVFDVVNATHREAEVADAHLEQRRNESQSLQYYELSRRKIACTFDFNYNANNDLS